MTTDSASRKPDWVLDHIKRYQETNGEYGEYQARTNREVPVVVLERQGA